MGLILPTNNIFGDVSIIQNSLCVLQLLIIFNLTVNFCFLLIFFTLNL